jgi:hypothetical protein
MIDAEMKILSIILLKFPFGYSFIFLSVITISLLVIFDKTSEFINYFSLLPAITMTSFWIFWILRPFRKYYNNSQLEISKKKIVLLLDIIFYIFFPFICLGFLYVHNKNIIDGDMTNIGSNSIIYFLMLISFMLNWIIKYIFMKIK